MVPSLTPYDFPFIAANMLFGRKFLPNNMFAAMLPSAK